MCNVFASERRQKHLNPLIKTGENTENIFKLQLEHYFTTMIGWITTKKFQVEVPLVHLVGKHGEPNLEESQGEIAMQKQHLLVI